MSRWGRGIVLGLVGLVLLALGIGLWASSSARSASTTGTVVDLEGTVDGQRAVIEFAVDGQVHQVVSGLAQRPAPTVGDEVTLTYDPADPGNADLDDPLVTTWGPLGLGAGGLLLLGLGLVGALRRSPGPPTG